ncbi:MAG: hypothetical protein ACI9MC_003354 [Kiritimatiellia bacterium]|jgi:hypothetical protein
MDTLMMLKDGGPWALLVLSLGGISALTALVTGVLHILKRPAPALLSVAPMGLAAVVVLAARAASVSAIPYALATASPEMSMTLVARHVSESIGVHLALGLAVTLPCVIAILLSAVASLRSKTRGFGLPVAAIVVACIAAFTPLALFVLGYSDLSSVWRGGLYLLLGIGCAVALLGKDPAAQQAGIVAVACFAIVVLSGEMYAITLDSTEAFTAIAVAPSELKASVGAQSSLMIQGATWVTTPAAVAVMLLTITALARRISTPSGAPLAAMSVACVAAVFAVMLDCTGAFTWLVATL